MGTGSGICSQFGFKNETVAGTEVTVDHHLKHVSIGGDGLQNIAVTDEGLGGCALVPTVDRTVLVGSQTQRDVELNPGSRGLGLWLKQMVGSSATAAQIAATAAYRQIHWLGDVATKSMTVQFGFPEATATGTVRPITMRGVKVTQWELSQARNELAKLRMSLDGWAETTATALATASYPTGTGATSNEPFRFNNFSAKIGGTPSVASGLVSIAGGTEIAGCRGASAKGVLPLRLDGFYSGGAGVKQEQILAGFMQYTADLDLEFRSRTQVYDVYAAYSTVALELTWTGFIDIASSNFGKLSVIMPLSKINTSGVNVSGPEVLDNKSSIMAYGDPAGTLPAIQIEYISADTTL